MDLMQLMLFRWAGVICREEFALFMARSFRSLKLSTKGLLATGSYVQLHVVACCLFERWFVRIPDITLFYNFHGKNVYVLIVLNILAHE